MRQFLSANPHFGNVFKQMIKEGIREETKCDKTKESSQNMAQKQDKAKEGKSEGQVITTIADNQSIETVICPEKRTPVPVTVKSPLDMTIYAPALNKIAVQEVAEKNDLIDRISNFVEGIRMETQERTSNKDSPSTSGRKVVQPEESVNDKASRLVLEAEKFHATVDTPKGMEYDNSDNLNANEAFNKGRVEPPPVQQNLVNYDNMDDDDYFHLTCHMYSALKAKIEKGEFIELDRLLPKRHMGQDNR